MSGLAAFTGPGAGYIVTDRANFDGDGRLCFRREKIVRLPRLHMAVAITGLTFTAWQAQLRRDAAEWRTQADALAAFPDFARSTHDRLPSGGVGDQRHHNYLVAWWAEDTANARFALCAGGADHIASTYCPFEMLPVGDVISPAVPGIDVSIAAVFPNFNPVMLAKRIAQAQRETPFDDGRHYVGVAADLTMITAAGLRSRAVLWWPDRTNQLIDPAIAPASTFSGSALRRLLSRH